MGAAASVIIAPISAAVGYGLTYIKDRHTKVQMLAVNVKKITKLVETRKTARIFAAIFSLGLTELMKHKEVSEEIFYEDEYIGSNETEAAEALNKKGNECYERGDYETAATFYARAFQITKDTDYNREKYKENLDRTKQKIREEAEKRQRENARRGQVALRREREEAARREQEALRREREEAARREQEALRREREQAARREQEALRREREQAARREQEALRREREVAAKRKQEIERKAIEALRLERARTLSKSLLEEATNIYQQAEAMSSLELKLENYEVALLKCKESCASGATEEAFKTLNKIFESCLKHDAHDEAEGAVQIVRTYFPSEAGRLQDILVNQQSETWSPDYESRVRQQQEQNRTITMMLA